MTLPPNGKATGETPTRWSVLLPATWPSSCNATIVIVGNAFLKILDGTLVVPSTRSGCSVNGPSAGLNGLCDGDEMVFTSVRDVVAVIVWSPRAASTVTCVA